MQFIELKYVYPNSWPITRLTGSDTQYLSDKIQSINQSIQPNNKSTNQLMNEYMKEWMNK